MNLLPCGSRTLEKDPLAPILLALVPIFVVFLGHIEIAYQRRTRIGANRPAGDRGAATAEVCTNLHRLATRITQLLSNRVPVSFPG
jgi:hypothetical protein